MNSLPKTVTRQRRYCDLNPGPSAPESSTLTTRLPSHPIGRNVKLSALCCCLISPFVDIIIEAIPVVSFARLRLPLATYTDRLRPENHKGVRNVLRLPMLLHRIVTSDTAVNTAYGHASDPFWTRDVHDKCRNIASSVALSC